MTHIPIVIIAAGRGQRFGSYPKVLSKINKKTIIHHILDAALQSGREKYFWCWDINLRK